jgi:adenine phosphoribosyltransferase
MEKIEKAVIQYLNENIRTIPDFPIKGIQFKDITTLLINPDAMKLTTDFLVRPFVGIAVDKVVGLESRGFLFGTNMAISMNAGFVPIRKPGKLPSSIKEINYELEYGSGTLQIHTDAIKPGDRVIIHDDLIATGGSADAARILVEDLGGEVIAYSFIIELLSLKGRNRLKQGISVHSLIGIE